MSDGIEEDYLSDKFLSELAEKSTSKPKTYHERRREAKRVSEQKNVSSRIRSRREIEEESRREGLSKSLFERAREEEERSSKRRRTSGGHEDQPSFGEDDARQPKNKALAMMLKMGFKEGQSLGRKDEQLSRESDPSNVHNADTDHLVEPIPLAMWAGRQGLGSGRRIFAAASSAKAPTDAAVNGLIPVTHDEAASQIEYRNRARSDFEQKRDVTRLMKARKTLLELDEKRGISFNILWIDPSNLETIPETMQAQLKDDDKFGQQRWGEGMNDHHVDKDRLRAQMRSDSLRPLVEDVDYGVSIDDEVPKDAPSKGTMTDFDPDTIQDTKDWLLLSVPERLRFTLGYLRQEYSYCFWCGVEYADQKEMDEQCPGESEEAHD